MTLPPHSDHSSYMLLDQALQKALTYCQNDQIEEAEYQYQTILKIQSDQPEANYSLGLLALRKKQPLESLPYFETALDKRPDYGPYWLAYIDALNQAGQSDFARQIFEMAQQAGLEGEEAVALATRLGIQPEIPTVRPDTSDLSLSTSSNPVNNSIPDQENIDTLLSLFRQGRLTACEDLALSILDRFPNHGFSWKILGAVLKQQERLDEAISAMRQAALLLPQDPEALNNLGLMLKIMGNLAESESILRLALDLNKDFAEAYNNLGVTLMAQGKLADSEECFRQALRIQPEYAEAYCNLGSNLKDQGQFADSESNLQQALKLRPSSAEAYNNLGNFLQGQGRLFEAEASLRKALDLKPDFAVAYNNLGNTLQGQGLLKDSESCYRQALELKPDYKEAFDSLLFVSNYHPDKSADELFELYREYDARFGLPHQVQWKPHTNNRDSDRRLKVGYVSPAFYRHPVCHFLEPLLAHHDKSRFEIFAYSETIREDPITTYYKQHIDHWIPTIGLSDTELAERIREDGIDILVDLAGHTSRNRLGVFARKPAPVSLHWLDFGYTTGLSALDYYLTDIASAPLGSENLFSEQLWRLSTPALAYRPETDMGPVGPLPAAQHGYVTFGTLTRAIRINHRTIRVWTEILQRTPNSKLVINSGSFKDQDMAATMLSKFTAAGLAPDRLEIGYHSPPWDVLRGMDISLDCFPHNSGTTLVESLYMGVPFITLTGPPAIGRLGASILKGAGHPEWIATSEDEYITKAITLAADIQQLSAIRKKLRQEISNSTLMDEEGFTGRVEAAYWMMFSKWARPHLQQTATTDIIPDEQAACRQAIEHYNKGVDFQAGNQIEKAGNEYLLAINIRPEFPEPCNNLGAIAMSAKAYDEAAACLDRALALNPHFPDARYNLATCRKLQQMPLEAEEEYRRVIALNPDHAEAHYQLGNILQEQGRPEEAELSIRQALRLKPDHLKAFSTLLFTLNYHPDKSGPEIFAAYQECNARFFQSHQRAWVPHSTGKHRRLRVGYVAPDYRRHPARHFIMPLLAHHDKTHFKIHAYVELVPEEAATDLFFPYVEQWFPAAGLSDEQLCDRIRKDEIDILIDLAGHTSGNRLGVFARKPAPVSLHWLDFGYTTGLQAIDYYLTDAMTVPPGSESLFSETPWRIPTPALAYRPPDTTGPVSPLPALTSGYITFGTLTRATRINHRTIRVWAAILQRCPSSRLIINSGSFHGPAMREAMISRFLSQGITRERLIIGCTSPPWDVLRNMDIGLDCFPHNSGTTLVESLYMGVPYITLIGRPSVGRLGASILEGTGHPEWIVTTEESYIEKAVELATDLQKLATIRMNLRREMTASPLMDEAGFTRKMETAFQAMFRKWEDATLPSPPATDNLVKPGPKQPKPLHHKTKPRTAQAASPPSAEIQRLARLFDQGKKNEALALATTLTHRFPRHGFAWKVLGPLLYQQGKPEEAIEAMTRATACLPDDAEAHANLGIALQQSGLPGDAEQSYCRAIHCNRNHIQAHYNLANILKEQSRFSEAEIHYKQILQLNPDFLEACCNLGNVLKDQGRTAEAETYYRQALRLKPDASEMHYNLGNTLRLQSRLPEAVSSFLQALQLNPNFTKACNNLGVCFKEQGLFSQAEAMYRKAIMLLPHYAEAHSNLGSLFSLQGRLVEAEDSLTHALQLNPDLATTHSNLLFLMNYHPDKSAREIFQFYKNFDTRIGLPLHQEWQPHGNIRETSRRLKVGYVCPQFCQHPIQYFLEPLLAHHDRRQVEVYLYAGNDKEDAITSRYKTYADHWVPTTTLNDLNMAQHIRLNGIDVLVDIAGHTGGNRLQVFARKPAPVSLHWLDFGYTTGLTAIDYYLADSATVPAGSEELFSETPWRIATPCLAYRPPKGINAVNALPAAKHGFVTFGTLTRVVRINHRTIRVWAEILQKTPNSKLIINSGSFKDSAMQEELAGKFMALGIARERLEIGYHSPPWDVLGQIDIGLDCFPHNSGTTLFESLYMGVPFITLADRPSVGRLGCSILEGVGHPEWIAQTEEEYEQKAMALAADLPRLATLRAGLRQEMASSPLMDESGFARKVETAYREMFAKWCEGEQTAQPKLENDEIAGASFQAVLHAAEIHDQAGRFQEAAGLYLAILEPYPQHPEANYRMGCLMVAGQQPSAALPYFVTAVEVCPEHGPYWLAYIDALDRNGQTESARQLMEMAVQAGLDGEEAETLKNRLTPAPIDIPDATAKKATPFVKWGEEQQ